MPFGSHSERGPHNDLRANKLRHNGQMGMPNSQTGTSQIRAAMALSCGHLGRGLTPMQMRTRIFRL